MSVNSPLSGRKTREVAGKAISATNLQAEILKGLIDKHNSLVKDVAETFTAHATVIDSYRGAFFGRNLFGRLKFLVLGR